MVRVRRDGSEVVLSYHEVRDRAERILGGLRARGMRPGDEVLLQVEAAEEFVPTLWACILGGFPAVPAGVAGPDGTSPVAQRLRGAWMTLDHPLVVAGSGPDGAVRAVLGDDARVAPVAELAAHAPDPKWHPSPPDAVAVLLLTSGTTGRPKLIRRTHHNLLRVCQGTVAQAGFAGRRTVFLNWMPLDHNAALTVSLVLVSAGAHQVHLGTRDVLDDPERWLEALHRYRVTHTGGTNFSLGLVNGRLAAGGERAWDFSCVERITVTAEPVVACTARTFLERMSRYGLRRDALSAAYGMSEAGGIARLPAFLPDGSGDGDGFVEVGCPYPGISIRVVDAEGKVVPEGCEGRIQVRGETVTPGYAGDAADARESFAEDGWFDTGDSGLLRGGSLVVTGREKDVLILNGLNVQSQEVEAAVEEVEGVARGCTAVCAVRIPGRDTDAAAVFLYTTRSGAEERSALRREVRRVVTSRFGATPTHVLLVGREELPRTPLGKIRRSELRRRLEAGGFAGAEEEDAVVGDEGREAPRTELEREICALWAEALGVERVEVHDDFMGLGGHSLLAGRIAARVRAVSGVDMPLRFLFEHPTVAGLAEAVEELRRSGGGAGASPPVRAPLDGPVPLSFAQQRLWFIDRLRPGNSVYNLSRALRLRGPLDVPALERALGEVVRRHEALRATFHERDGEPVQVIAPPAAPELPVDDLSALEEGAREAELARRMGEAATGPYDLSRGPLFRAKLLRTGPEENLLLLCMHHIVGDGWSIGVLFRELEALYAAFLRGEPSPLPALPVRYADHAVRQRAELGGEALDRQLAYWRERLAGAPAVLELPADRARPPVQSHRGALCRFVLAPELGGRVAALGRSEGATLFMTLLAALQVLLGKYAGSDDVVVGTPVAGRARPELEGLIGLFVNMLPLRTGLSGDPTFRELLVRVRKGTLGAYAHQELPFERLVEELQPERSLAHSPVFQVTLALQNAGGAPPRLPGVETVPVRTDGNAAMFDLSLSVAEEDGGLYGSLEYATDLFDAATAERMLVHLRVLLEGAVAAPERRISELEMLDAEERAQVLSALGATARTFPAEGTLHGLFSHRAACAPDRVAASLGGEHLTYGELERRASRLARWLRARGVGPEARVGLCLERSLEMVTAILGVLKAGGAYVPLDPAYPQARLAYTLEDAGIGIVLTHAAVADRLPAGAAEVVMLDALAERFATDDGAPLPESAGPQSLAYVIYTSGSTGRPKGVQVTHGNVLRLFSATEEWFRFGEEDVWTLFHSYAFDFSVWEIWGALLYGGRLVVVPHFTSRSPEEFHHFVVRERVTVLNQTPSAFRQFMQADLASGVPADGLALRYVVFGGEALEPASLRPWVEKHGEERPRLVNMYGITETTVHVTYRPLARRDVEAGVASVIGVPIPDLRVYVLDPHRRPVPVGVPGELYVGGAGVARGYLNRPELTEERFLRDPFGGPGERVYRSGDRARWLRTGELEYLGRLDEQVKVRGYRIELGEIEAVLRAHPGVGDCVVGAREDAPGERRLVAYVVGADAAPGAAALRAHLREHLPDHMVPSVVVALERLPLTPNGKTDRRALPAPEPMDEGEAEAPATPTEEVLAGIWADLLGRERVGRTDGFFELGGHSLLAARLLARTREALRAEVPLRAVFEYPVLRDFAAQVDAARGGPVLPPVTPADRSGPLPLSYAQQRFWFLDRLAPGSPAYNTPLPVRLTGPLNVAALSAALHAVVRRHEALRTRFPDVRGEPVQVVDPAPEPDVPVVDLEALPAAAREEKLLRLARAEAGRPFDLAHGPLLRATVVRLAEEDHVLLLVTHHIVFDGSHRVFQRELSTFYAAFARGEPSPLPELPIQYPDFAVWQHSSFTEEVLERQVAYWRECLADAPSLLELPTDRPRRIVPQPRGAVCSFVVPGPVVEGLRELGRRSDATLFMTVLAAFKALLARYSGQGDVLVGTPVAHRARAELDEMVGCFSNTLVLRTQMGDDPEFPSLLSRVRETCLEAYAHQDVPFERLVGALNVDRNIGHSPLFQTMLVLHPYAGRPALALPGVRASALPPETGSARFDLLLALSEGADRLTGLLEYSAELFDAATARRILEHLGVLLQGVAAAAGRRISELPLLAAAERRRVVEEWNDTDRDFPRGACIHDAFEARAARTPGAPAVVFEGRVLTYGELDRLANRLAHRLRRLGVGRGAYVGVWLERSAEMVPALLAVLKAAAAYVPLEPAWPEARARYILASLGVRCVLSERSLVPALERIAAEPSALRHIIPLDGLCTGAMDGELAALPATPPERAVGADDLAYVVFTSGSTGTPKGVMVQHRPVVNLIDWFNRTFEVGPADRVLFVTSLCFDLSVYDVFGVLAAGGCIRVATRGELRSPERLVAALAGEGVTLWDSAPAALQQLVPFFPPGGTPGSALRRVFLSGDWIPVGLPDQVRGAFPGAEVVSLGGATEAAIWSNFFRIGEVGPDWVSIPYGVGIQNARYYVLDAQLSPCPIGVPGDLYIGGECLALGYALAPELTAGKFVPDPFAGRPGARLYRTGDRTRWRAAGWLEFLGRLDHQVKVRGFRIELGEIEAALSQHPGVRDRVVVVREDTPGDRRLVGYVVPVRGAEPAPAELRSFLKERLPEYMVPSVFVLLDTLPVTLNGKLDRKALPAPDASPWSSSRPSVPPRTPTEEAVAAAWREVLGVDGVGMEDDFFELGGHSLLVTRVVARVQEAFGVSVPLRMLFDGATPGEMAAFVDRAREERDRELVALLDGLSDGEVRALLAAEPGPPRETELQ